MKWNTSAHAGFSAGTPWQRENESYLTINAESQVGVKGSVFEYWASILRLRKSYIDIFVYGSFKLVNDGSQEVFAYLRSFENETVIVVCNFKKEAIKWSLPEGFSLRDVEVLVGNYEEGKVKVVEGQIELRPFEAFAAFLK